MSDATVTEVDALRAALESRDAQLSRQNAGLVQMARERDALRADAIRLQSELDALRAIVESGCDACAHATPKHPASQEATLAEARGVLDGDGDDLRGLAGKGAT